MSPTESPARLLQHVEALRASSLAAKVVLAMVAGLSVGVLLGPEVGLGPAKVRTTSLQILGLPGEIFLALLQMVVVPLVFASIARGITEFGETGPLKSVGLRFAAYTLTTTLAMVVGLVIGWAVDPGRSIDAAAVAAEAPPQLPAARRDRRHHGLLHLEFRRRHAFDHPHGRRGAWCPSTGGTACDAPWSHDEHGRHGPLPDGGRDVPGVGERDRLGARGALRPRAYDPRGIGGHSRHPRARARRAHLGDVHGGGPTGGRGARLRRRPYSRHAAHGRERHE